jgi:hypothetical protein
MSTPRTERRGRHERIRAGWTGPGRHASDGPVSHLVTTTIRCCLLVVPVSILIAVVTTLTFPKVTSNASSGSGTQDDASEAAADPTVGSAVETVASSAQICPIDWQRSAWHVKKLIRCAADYYGVSRTEALYIAWRESRYQPSAYNPTGDAAGIYQHVLRYWPDRAETYGFPNSSAFNARANIMVTMQMVRSIGWWPWGG